MRKALGLLLVGMFFVWISLGVSGALAASKNVDTGRYVFQDYETLKPGLFVLDPAKKRYVDSGYQAFMSQSVPASQALAADNAADRAYWKNWRRAAMYFPVTTSLAVVGECAQARAVEWTAADAYLLGKGKNSPFGCAAYSEILGGFDGVVSAPEGPAFSLLWGPFCGFSGELDPVTGAGRNSSLLYTAARGAAKGVIFGLALNSPGVQFDRVAYPPLHNAFAWSGMSTIPGNILGSLALYGKGISYPELLIYQNSSLNTGNAGIDFRPSVKANTKFRQIVF